MHEPSISTDTAHMFEQGNSNNTSGTVQALYMPPFSWNHPFHHEVSESCIQHSHAFGDKVSVQSCTALDNEDRASESTHKHEQVIATGSSADEKSELDQGKHLPEKLRSSCSRPPDEVSSVVPRVAVAVAMEERKRRKELARLKHNHVRRAGRHT